jgi:deoxycytidylate deaminase
VLPRNRTPRPAAGISALGQHRTHEVYAEGVASIAAADLAAAAITAILVVGLFPCNPSRDRVSIQQRGIADAAA